ATDSDTATEPAPAADAGGTRPIRRAPGDLDRAILRILHSQPDNVFKVGELCKLINKAEEGAGVPKASPGAVVLAAQRLVKRQPAAFSPAFSSPRSPSGGCTARCAPHGTRPTTTTPPACPTGGRSWPLSRTRSAPTGHSGWSCSTLTGSRRSTTATATRPATT